MEMNPRFRGPQVHALQAEGRRLKKKQRQKDSGKNIRRGNLFAPIFCLRFLRRAVRDDPSVSRQPEKAREA
jgi:hypothetical protein